MVSGNAPPVLDGVGDFTAMLLHELARQRPDWEWVWMAKRPRWFQSAWPRRVGGVRLFRPSHSWSSTGKAIAAAMAARVRPALLHVQEQIHSFHETDAAVRIASAVNSPLVTTLHEYHTELPSVAHTDALVNLSDALISNDPRNTDRCRERTGRNVDLSLWSGTSVAPEFTAADPRPATRPGLVVTFGFLSALKSLGLIHDALRLARRDRPEIRWRIIGPYHPETDPHHAALGETLAADTDWIELTGGVADHARLRGLLAEAAVMVLPFADGASVRRTTLQAAWAFGLPVVTTPPDRPTDAVVDGDNALLVREPAGDAWAAAVSRVLSDRALAQTLRSGSLRAAERFSWPRLASEHLALYDELLGRPSPSRRGRP